MTLNIQDLHELLIELAKQINDDPGLTPEAKQSVLNVIEEVDLDPTQGNVAALSIVIDKLSDSNRYISAMSTLTHLQAEAAIKESQ